MRTINDLNILIDTTRDTLDYMAGKYTELSQQIVTEENLTATNLTAAEENLTAADAITLNGLYQAMRDLQNEAYTLQQTMQAWCREAKTLAELNGHKLIADLAMNHTLGVVYNCNLTETNISIPIPEAIPEPTPTVMEEFI